MEKIEILLREWALMEYFHKTEITECQLLISIIAQEQLEVINFFKKNFNIIPTKSRK